MKPQTLTMIHDAISGARAGLKELFRFVHWPSWLLLWASLAFLRWQLLGAIGITVPAAWEMDLGLGLHSDLTAALIPLVLAWAALGLVGLPRYVGFPVVAGVIWISTWGNLLYISHFGVMLDWWVVEFHLGDITDLGGNIRQIGIAWRIVVSFLLLLAALAIFIRREVAVVRAHKEKKVRAAGRGLGGGRHLAGAALLGRGSPVAYLGAFLKARLLISLRAAGVVLLFFVVQQSPRLFHLHSIGHPVNSHVLKTWYAQNFTRSPFSGLDQKAGRAYGRKVQAGQGENPGFLLARYRDFREADWTAANGDGANGKAPGGAGANGPGGLSVALPAAAGSGKENTAKGNPAQENNAQENNAGNKTGGLLTSGTATANHAGSEPGPAASQDKGNAGEGAWPLLRDFAPAPESTRALRRQLGLPEEGPINVILLLVEGFRWYELSHPYIGPRVHPRINRLLKKHGIVFSQGYSSASTAGQTVRGSFSIFCSFLPNIIGPATYIAYSTIRVRCLPELMKENGYVTLWFNSHRKNSHNKSFFEGKNGVDHFYDREFFDGLGITERVGDWGLGDQPVMKASLKKLREWAGGDKPVYAQIVTVSTHTPVAPAPGVKFDPEFERILAADKEYRDFMSMFRYTDEAVGDFVEDLFQSEMGGNTVIFLAGDHSNGGVPPAPLALDALQHFDARFRIPVAVLTKAMPKPGIRRRVVHQMDMVPTAARLAGVSGKVTWLGKGLFHPGGEGTPWVFSDKGKIYWRSQTRGCYGGKCYDLRFHDPTMQKNPPQIPALPEMDRFFRAVIEAGGVAIGSNRISPID